MTLNQKQRSRAGIFFFLFVLLSSPNMIFARNDEDLVIVTNYIPPYSIVQKGQLKGIAVDIVKDLIKDTDSQGKIKLLPWKRARNASLKQKMMIFPFTRRPFREKHYKWIGPIMNDRFVFAVCNEDVEDYRSIDSFRNLQIGVAEGTPTEYRLKNLNFKKLQAVPLEKQNAIKLLGYHRIDAWYSTSLIIEYTLKSLGFEQKEIRIAFSDTIVEMYIAASLRVPDELVTKWQTSLDAMKADGRYQTIIDRNEGEWEDIHEGKNRFIHNPIKMR